MAKNQIFMLSQEKIRKDARRLFWLSLVTLFGTGIVAFSVTAGLVSLGLTIILWLLCYRKLSELTHNAVQHEQHIQQKGKRIRMKVDAMQNTRRHINNKEVIALTLSFPDVPEETITVSEPLSALALNTIMKRGYADIRYLEQTGDARLEPLDAVSPDVV